MTSANWSCAGPAIRNRAEVPGSRAGAVVKARVKRSIARVLAAGRARGDRQRGVGILAYHTTESDNRSPAWVDFRGQMSLIEDQGWSVVGLDEAIDMIQGRAELRRPTLAITFDDGWSSNLEVAFPELARRGWPAIVFVTTSYLDRNRYLPSSALRHLSEQRIAIGNHTHGHPDLRSLPPDGILDEIDQCGRRLRDLTGRTPRHFCYPYGRYSPLVRDAVSRAGLQSACSGRVGFNPKGSDPFVLRRLTVEPREGPDELGLRLAGGYDFLDRKQRWMDRR